jgi:ubiquinol-cytochrome c reductase cytochrome c1 subunit
MIKPFSSLVKAAMFSALLAAGYARAEEGTCLPFGETVTTPTEVKTLQTGAKLYFNYCSSCHSLKYMRYSRLAQDLEITEAQMLKSFSFTGAVAGDFVVNNMPAGGRGHPPGSLEWFGQTPPDLSLTARSRGTDWIYNYLMSFYPDPSRPVGWNNLTFPNASMPNPLWELQGIQSHLAKPAGHESGHEAGAEAGHGGACSPAALKLETPGKMSPAEYENNIRALTSFLEYVGEPAIKVRESIGIWVLFYLCILTFLLYLLKSEYWKDVH